MKLAARAEYYNDKNQVIITTNTPNGFQVWGFSTNFDYHINDKMQFRIEGKSYTARDAIFNKNSHQNYMITTNMTVRF
jgi:hypothetical protein